MKANTICCFDFETFKKNFESAHNWTDYWDFEVYNNSDSYMTNIIITGDCACKVPELCLLDIQYIERTQQPPIIYIGREDHCRVCDHTGAIEFKLAIIENLVKDSLWIFNPDTRCDTCIYRYEYLLTKKCNKVYQQV